MKISFNLHAPASQRARVFCAVATALLLWIPAQKWGLFPLAWFGLAPFLWACGTLPSRARFRYGWASGFLFYALTNWWIAPTVVYGAPMIGVGPAFGFTLGVISVSFISVVHGLQFAIAAWLWDENRWHGRLWLLPFIVAAWWQLFDYVRCIPPLAHIWGALAFTQWRDTALLQILPFVGQHGLTALLVWCGASLALRLRYRQTAFWLAPFCVFFALHGLGMWQVLNHRIAATFPTLLVSTAVPSLRKSGLDEGETPVTQALRLTKIKVLRRSSVELIVWPETTLEFTGKLSSVGREYAKYGRMYLDSSLNMVDDLSRTLGAALLSGAHHHQVSGLGRTLSNTALLHHYGSRSMQAAPKIRTVPFGEKAPFGDWLPFLKRFAPEPEITPGTEPKTIQLLSADLDMPVGTVICFESCFPDPARTLVKKGAKALFVLTNDEWFKGTNAPWEHAAMAVIRAAENRVPVAQVANGGYTLLVDSRGRILHQSFGAGATPVSIPLN